MTLDNVIGLPMGVMPEEGTVKHRDWLRASILRTHELYKTVRNSMVTENYLADMDLYVALYPECWTGEE